MIKQVIILFCIAIQYHKCQEFCDNLLINSSFTYESITYLFQGDYVWEYHYDNRSVNNKQTIDRKFFVNRFIINTAFVHKYFGLDILYMFSDKMYFLRSLSKSESGMTVNKIRNKTLVPHKWHPHAGQLSDWFPSHLSDGLVVNDMLFLFRRFKVFHTLINYYWPKDNKTLLFGGSMAEVTKVDAIFTVSHNKQVIIIWNLKYCIFDRKLIEDKVLDSFTVNCKWENVTQLFGCSQLNSTTTLTVDISTTDTNNLNVDNMTTEVTNNDEVTQTNQSIDKLTIILIVLILIVLIILCAFSLIICFKYGISQKKKSTKLTDPMSSITLNETTIKTIDSQTGITVKSRKSQTTE